MVKQIRETDKGKMKYAQMQEWDPTLAGILRRRLYLLTEYKNKVLENLSSTILLLPLQFPRQLLVSRNKNPAKSSFTKITL